MIGMILMLLFVMRFVVFFMMLDARFMNICFHPGPFRMSVVPFGVMLIHPSRVVAVPPVTVVPVMLVVVVAFASATVHGMATITPLLMFVVPLPAMIVVVGAHLKNLLMRVGMIVQPFRKIRMVPQVRRSGH